MEKSKKIYYLAGPMSGKPYFNIPEFAKVSADLRFQGLAVINPAELDDPAVREHAAQSLDGDVSKLVEETGITWGDCLARDVKIVADEATDIILLPGWPDSRGACLELYVALVSGKGMWEWNGECVVALPHDTATFLLALNLRRVNEALERKYG